MAIKFTDCALKVMDALWEMGEGHALDLVTTLIKRVGWSKSTAYTVLIDKMFGGSNQLFFSAFLKNRGVSEKEAEKLTKLIAGNE